MTRLAGIETEYGCLTADPSGSLETVRKVRDWLFVEARYGLLDRQQRDWDEPAGNGGFLFNGGRAYLDMGHLELCTAECLGLRDLIAQDAASDAMICEAVAALHLGERAGFIRNNVDHYSGATFGCHENYLVRRAAPLTERNVLSLLAFLTLRILYTGAGKVGGVPGVEARGGGAAPGVFVPFQLSQRADYIQNDLFEWVQFNRAIINTRDEPLADARRFRRLHLLHGDTSVLPETLALKIGTTSLVLDLLEIDHLPRIVLIDAVGAFRSLSSNPDGPWRVELADLGEADVVEILGKFHAAARAEFAGRDEETDLILASWGAALDGLAGDRSTLVGRVDWVTKRWLFQQFVESEGLRWDSPWLRSQDLEFHHTLPSRSLGRALADPLSPWNPTPEAVRSARTTPPSDTRAAARSRLMRFLAAEGLPGFVDWEIVDTEGVNPVSLLDPFDPNPPEADAWIQEVRDSRIPRASRNEGTRKSPGTPAADR